MSKISYSTPLEDGFRMIAEWEGSKKVWMLWPERIDNWRDNAVPAQKKFAEVANMIAKHRPMVVGVSRKHFSSAKKLLVDSVIIKIIDYDDSWIRDTGPTFVANSKGDVRAIDWDFNAWGGSDGGLYDYWERDKLVASKVIKIENIDFYKAPIILEGGSIHVDGQGTLITTEECLLNKNRNSQASKAKIERILEEYCGVGKIIWLKRGLYNDETNGHIDNIFSFVKPGVGLLSWTDDKDDPNYEISREALSILKQEKDSRGRCLEIIKITQPMAQFISKTESLGVNKILGSYPRNEGDRLICSYINYYRDKDFILLPFFGDKEADKNAYDIFIKIFPGYRITPVYCREIILGGGGIHCITLNQP